jgi:hypothetical protein
MFEKKVDHQTNWTSFPTTKMDKETTTSVGNNRESIYSGVKNKQSAAEMEEIVSKLITHLKENR